MLKRVSIQNFKSLKDVTLDLQKVNLLIGPNNSGKTNFLKALEYLSKCIDGSRGFTYQDQYKKNLENTLKIHLVYEEISGKSRYNHFVTTLIDKEFESSYYTIYGVYDSNFEMTDPDAFSDEVHAESFKNSYGIFNIYKIDPNKVYQPGPVGNGEEIVDSDASNLIGFLDLMLGKHRRTVFNKIEIDLHACLPEFDEINLDDTVPTESLKKQYGDKSFKRLGLSNSSQGITYWADELSEGTLYFLALLCIINQPNPPKLLLLEEPEKGIHPRRIREVMDFIFRLAEEKDVQIILTTHNEHVLDDFTTWPESVFVFDKDDEGATYVRNLQKDIIEPTNQRHRELGLDEIDLTTNLSENWLYGLLGGVPTIP